MAETYRSEETLVGDERAQLAAFLAWADAEAITALASDAAATT